MPQVTIAINNQILSGFFETLNEEDQIVTKSNNVISHTFDVPEGKTYRTAMVITGSNGSKFKITVAGASTSVYPDEEQTINNQRNDYVIRTTG